MLIDYDMTLEEVLNKIDGEDGNRRAIFYTNVLKPVEDDEDLHGNTTTLMEHRGVACRCIVCYGILFEDGEVMLIPVTMDGRALCELPEGGVSASLKSREKIETIVLNKLKAKFPNLARTCANSCSDSDSYNNRPIIFYDDFVEIAEHLKPYGKQISRYLTSESLLKGTSPYRKVEFGWLPDKGVIFDIGKNGLMANLYENDKDYAIPKFVNTVGYYYGGDYSEVKFPASVNRFGRNFLDRIAGDILVIPDTIKYVEGDVGTVDYNYIVFPDTLRFVDCVTFDGVSGAIIISEEFMKRNADTIVFARATLNYEQFWERGKKNCYVFAVVPDVKNYQQYIDEGIDKYILNNDMLREIKQRLNRGVLDDKFLIR